MQDLAFILGHGALILGYCSSILAFFLLHNRARKSSPDCPMLQIHWWKLFVRYLCAALLVGAIGWIIGIAHLFAHLTSSLNGICTTHVTPEACTRAASNWQTITALLVENGILAMVVIAIVTYAEAKRTEAPPERSYPLVLLTWSHGLLVNSWLLCTPLQHSLKVFSLVGTNYWIAWSLIMALFSILAYIIGITLWILAVVRLYFAWLRTEMDRSSGEERGIDRGRDIVLSDLHPRVGD